jgi:hypothetical protein
MSAIETGMGPAVGMVQTDTFCEGCGYNLHTQMVVRDERLGILICRCPECGRYSAVGQTTTAARAWLNRLATILLTGWVFFLLLLFALCSLFLGMIAYGHVGDMTEIRPTFNTWAATRPARPPNRYYQSRYYPFRYGVRQIPNDATDEQTRHLWAQGWLTFFAVLLGLITGVLFSSLVWHCQGRSRLWGFLPPVAGCGVAGILWFSNPMTELIRDWGLLQIGLFFLVEMVAVGIGLWIGRSFARGLVRILVPPRPRQHLAFLWITDGKAPTPM